MISPSAAGCAAVVDVVPVFGWWTVAFDALDARARVLVALSRRSLAVCVFAPTFPRVAVFPAGGDASAVTVTGFAAAPRVVFERVDVPTPALVVLSPVPGELALLGVAAAFVGAAFVGAAFVAAALVPAVLVPAALVAAVLLGAVFVVVALVDVVAAAVVEAFVAAVSCAVDPPVAVVAFDAVAFDAVALAGDLVERLAAALAAFAGPAG
jgi:hypothetical protein